MQTNLQRKIVLDAWAILAFIFGEQPAAETVRALIERKEAKSVLNLSWMNLAEVYYTIARRKGREEADNVLADIQLLPIRLHEPSKTDILAAARIKSRHRLSFADAFAVALTQKTQGVIYTGDPEIIALEDVVAVNRLKRAQ